MLRNVFKRQVRGLCCAIALLCLPAIASAQRAYVANSTDNTVSAIDASVNPPVVIGAPIAVGNDPNAVAATQDGKTLYVANFGGLSVSVVNVALGTPTIVATVSLGNNPKGLVLSPDGKSVYVTYGNTLGVIDATANPPAIASSVVFGSSPSGIAISPDGKTVYAADFLSNMVYFVDVSASPPVVNSTSVDVGAEPFKLAVSNDGNTLYASCEGTQSVSVIDLSTNPPTAKPSISLGTSQQGIALAPDGKTLYTANSGTSVSAIDLTTNPPTVGTINAAATSIAVSQDSGTVYAGSISGNSIWVISAASKTVTSTLTVGNGVYAITFATEPPPLAPSATSLTLDPTSALIGQSVTANVKITFPLLGITNAPGVPTGSVVITDGTVSCTAALSPGSGPTGIGSCPLSFASAGTHTLTATYSGDGLYKSSNGTADETVIPVQLSMAFAPTVVIEGATASLSVSLNNVGSSDVHINSLTVTTPAQLSGLSILSNDCSGSFGLTPTQAILTGGAIGLSSSCTFIIGTTSTTPATYTFTIAAGDLQTTAGNNSAAISADLDVVAPIAPTVAMSFSPASITASGSSLLTFTLANANVTALLLVGLDDTLPSGVVIADPANATTTCPNAGVIASPGGTSLSVSNSAVGPVTSTIPALGSCTASVLVTASSAGSYIDTIPAGALQTQTTLPADSVFIGIADNSIAAVTQTLVVNAAPLIATTTSLSANPNPATLGQPVAISASVAPTSMVSGGTGSPSGTVTVSEGALACAITLSAAAGGSAGSCMLTFSTPGAHILQASYLGDASFAASNAAPYSLTVNPAPLIATTTTLTASPNPTSIGQSVNASVLVVGETTTTALSKALIAATAPTPAGAVSIGDGVVNCTAMLANGSGSCALIFASSGTHVLTATYGGDANYAASSTTANEVVNAAPPASSATPAPALDLRGLLILLLAVCVIGVLTRRVR